MTIATTLFLTASLLGDLGTAKAEPVVTPEPVVAAPEPAVAPEPVATPEPVVAAPEPAVAPEPVAAPEQAAVAAESVAPEAAPEAQAKPAKPSKKAKEAAGEPRNVRITSDRTDYDRKEGVIMFDGNVHVDDDEYQMCSKQLYVFLDGTNELKRIVAIGDVAITNETRHGSCAKAAYTKSAGKVVMYGDGKGTMAKLVDEGKRRSEVEGKKITFWIDSEQVEVEGSTVTLDAGGLGGKDGAKKLLGK